MATHTFTLTAEQESQWQSIFSSSFAVFVADKLGSLSAASKKANFEQYAAKLKNAGIPQSVLDLMAAESAKIPAK